MEIVLLFAAFIVRQHMHRQHIAFFFTLLVSSPRLFFLSLYESHPETPDVWSGVQKVEPPPSDPEKGRGCEGCEEFHWKFLGLTTDLPQGFKGYTCAQTRTRAHIHGQYRDLKNKCFFSVHTEQTLCTCCERTNETIAQSLWIRAWDSCEN